MDPIVTPAKPTFDFAAALGGLRAEKLSRAGQSSLQPPHTLKKDQWPPDYDQVMAWRQGALAKFELRPDLVKSAKAFYRTRPLRFINHWCNTYDPRNAGSGKLVKMPLVMF